MGLLGGPGLALRPEAPACEAWAAHRVGPSGARVAACTAGGTALLIVRHVLCANKGCATGGKGGEPLEGWAGRRYGVAAYAWAGTTTCATCTPGLGGPPRVVPSCRTIRSPCCSSYGRWASTDGGRVGKHHKRPWGRGERAKFGRGVACTAGGRRGGTRGGQRAVTIGGWLHRGEGGGRRHKLPHVSCEGVLNAGRRWGRCWVQRSSRASQPALQLVRQVGNALVWGYWAGAMSTGFGLWGMAHGDGRCPAKASCKASRPRDVLWQTLNRSTLPTRPNPMYRRRTSTTASYRNYRN